MEYLVLKKIIMKDKFNEDYCKFASYLIKKEYAKEVPEKSFEGHDAKRISNHIRRQEQLCVLSGCAAKHQEASLNTH